jgi:choline dehydrogenase-like flavoprotein
MSAIPNITDKHPISSVAIIPGRRRMRGISVDGPRDAGFGKALKSSIRKCYRPSSAWEVREVLPRKENRVMLDADVRTHGASPCFGSLRFSDNELKMAKDMADTLEEMLMVAGAENIRIARDPYPPGWSIHEIGTARMGVDPKGSVTDPSCRLHDVPNVYLADAAPFVSGGTQNTTWSILAMCWRTMDHVKDRMKKGEL